MFFPQPPRPRGRGWWRRLRSVAAWSLLLPVAAGLAFIAFDLSRELHALRTLASRGSRTTCTIISRRATPGKSPAWYVSLRRDDTGVELERRIAASDWTLSRIGGSSLYYFDPSTGFGFAEIERGYRDQLLPVVLLWIATIVALAIGGGGIAQNAGQMRLLRHGIELLTHGGGRFVGIPGTIYQRQTQLPAAWSHFIRVGPAGGEFVVLASRNLKSLLFPRQDDLPVERLVREEDIVPLLQSPIRDRSSDWMRWIRRKYRPARISTVLVAMITALVTLVTLCAGASSATVVTLSGVGGSLALLLFLAWMRGHWRDRVLWRDGDEVHAVVLRETWAQRVRTLAIGFSYHSREYGGQVRMSDEFTVLRADSPPSAPAVTERAVVLVDPLKPGRWAIVPSTCASREFT